MTESRATMPAVGLSWETPASGGLSTNSCSRRSTGDIRANIPK
jgi:hypothetical protein